MNKFDNFSTAEIETISNGLCMYTNSISNDPNKASRKIEAAIILDLLNEIDNRNQNRLDAINAELESINMLEEDNPELFNDYDSYSEPMNIDDFINSFNNEVSDNDLDEYNT